MIKHDCELSLGLGGHLESHALPFPVAIEDLQLYQGGHEFIAGSNRDKYFLRKVRRNLVDYPDELTEIIVSGESGGTNKTFRAGQWLAAFLTNSRFLDRLHEKTGKEPKGHYLSISMNLRELRLEGKVSSSHPYYTDREMALGWQRAGLTLGAARVNLPKIHPDCANFLIYEAPFNLLGPVTAIICQNTFVDISVTNNQAQIEAADDRDHLYPHLEKWLLKDHLEISDALRERDVVTDKEVEPEDITWNQGNRDSARTARLWVNGQILESHLPGLENLDLQTLENNHVLRNEVVLPVFYRAKLRQWRVPSGHSIVRTNPYRLGSKHLFVRLIQASMLDTKVIREFQL